MRLIDADALPRHGNRGGLVYWKDISEAPTIESEPKWIPCSEKLPAARAERYWVCTDGANQYECRWTNTNPFWTDLTTEWHWNIFDIPTHSKVIAWMPLPEPFCGAKMEDDV